MAIQITASVGRGGTNGKTDVKAIQSALNAVYPALLLDVDGICGTKTIRRIEKFQKRFMNNPDGRIDPDGSTLKRLNTAVPDLRDEWSGDSSKWPQDKKLKSLDGRMRLKVERILGRLKDEGFQPKIVYAWRSVSKQLELVDAGHSKVRFSFHNAQKKNGTPNAYAADIIDKRWAWTKAAEQNGFWEALGRSAKDEGLYWGGDWISFKDWAHIQFHPNYMLAEIKNESGIV